MNVPDSLAPRMSPEPAGRSRRHPVYEKSAQLWQQKPLRDIGPERIARALGWFGIGLGFAQLLAPRAVARLWGGDGRHSALIRF